ncbi:MAG: arginase family protein, partial [Notoacmeibacter sp.]|nr:arginase family protein [Notoacmeibacter sp.]
MPSKTIDHAFTARSRRGAAGDPTYAGALSFMRRPYSKSAAGADAVIWGIPFDAAVSNRPGARFGPQAIRRASAIFDNDPQYPFARDLFEAMAVIDHGDCLL